MDRPQPLCENRPQVMKKSESGQISVMVGIMMLTFLMLFVFVINTGMLVNAKINLQNAADMAAYSGASVQARQLTHISYLNYEMRRQWKKLIFRLYVVGNMGQDGFPRNGGPNAPMVYLPNLADAPYPLPSTCVVFNKDDNFCHIRTLPAISIPNQTFLDSITDTLRGQLLMIEQIRQKNCIAIGQTNKMLNIYWLFNPDPTASQLTAGLALDQANVLKVIRGLIQGLGIVPRELILNFRIKTLESYVNQPPMQGVQLESASGLLGRPDPPAFERTVQAFLAAYYTLGNNTFPGDSVVMDELVPQQLLKLNPIRLDKIDTITVDLGLAGQAAGMMQASAAAASDCQAQLFPVSVNPGLTVGVYKDPSIMTYYAVRLKAKANILFSPFGTLEMKAYSAAQPFGSRIGPPKADFVAKFTAPSVSAMIPAFDANIPNLPIRADDSASAGNGWDNKYVLGQMFAPLTAGGLLAVDEVSLARAYHHAMSPNPWEQNRYNIINDAGMDSFQRNFDTRGYAAIWAPVFPPDKMASASDQIKTAVNTLFLAPQGNVSFTAGAGAAIAPSIQLGLDKYVTGALMNGSGEDGESINIARLQNPLVSPQGVPVVSDGGGPQMKTYVTNPQEFKTSWNAVNDGNIRSQGRVGYSVKFVSFNNLTAKKLSTNGQAIWTNDLNMDGDADLDIPHIQH